MKMDFRSVDVGKRLAKVAHYDIIQPAENIARYLEHKNKKSGPAIEMPWEKLSGRFSIRPGDLVMLAGMTGHMKSTVTAQMVVCAMRQGYKVGMASLELPFGDIMDQIIELSACASSPTEEWAKQCLEWTRGKLFIYDRVDGIAPEDATAMTYAFKDLGCDLVVIDAMMMCGLDVEDYGAEKYFAQTMSGIAKSEDMAILMLHHTRKPPGADGERSQPGKYDMMGSSHIMNMCNSILMVWHDKQKAAAINSGGDFDDDQPCLTFSVAKNRGGKFEGTVGLWQHGNCRGFCSTSRRFLSPLQFDGNATPRGMA